MNKVYLLIYATTFGDREVIKNWFNQESGIVHWRYDLPNTFYIVSPKSASELSDSLGNFVGKKGRFLITEISDNRQGLLPKETWYLFKNKARMPKE